MRRTIITAIVLALAVTPLLAANAYAVPPSPNHVVIQTLGRRVVAYNHYGDPNRGHVTASAQGELVDTNGNGLANALRGRGALLESTGSSASACTPSSCRSSSPRPGGRWPSTTRTW